jgi:hypothetical protein
VEVAAESQEEVVVLQEVGGGSRQGGVESLDTDLGYLEEDVVLWVQRLL